MSCYRTIWLQNNQNWATPYLRKQRPSTITDTAAINIPHMSWTKSKTSRIDPSLERAGRSHVLLGSRVEYWILYPKPPPPSHQAFAGIFNSHCHVSPRVGSIHMLAAVSYAPEGTFFHSCRITAPLAPEITWVDVHFKEYEVPFGSRRPIHRRRCRKCQKTHRWNQKVAAQTFKG
jgi:hypothetical protein